MTHNKYFKDDKVIMNHEIPEKSLILVHPHGIFCIGWTLHVVFQL